MSAREILRRTLIWGVVAVFFAFAITLAVLGEWYTIAGFSAFPVVGAVILTSRRGNNVGRYLLGVGIFCMVVMWVNEPGLAALAPTWAESVCFALGYVFWMSLPLVGLLFPTGRLETRLGRAALWGLGALAVVVFTLGLVDPVPLSATGRANPFALPVLAFVSELVPYYTLPTLVVYLVIVIDLVRRWRRADTVTRLQYRWFVFGLLSMLTVVGAVVIANPTIFEGADSFLDYSMTVAATLVWNVIPITIGIAVTRHGLYEIGRVISRTISYAIVTALAAGVYALVVTSVTWLLPGMTSVGVALATLAAAALFLPVLRWVQRIVDRRFDRERYDAEKVVDAFGERLRTGADPASTVPELVDAVERALQPVSVGLWTVGGRR